MPPAGKRTRVVDSLGLREYDAEALTSTRPLSEYLEKLAAPATLDPAAGEELDRALPVQLRRRADR